VIGDGSGWKPLGHKSYSAFAPAGQSPAPPPHGLNKKQFL